MAKKVKISMQLEKDGKLLILNNFVFSGFDLTGKLWDVQKFQTQFWRYLGQYIQPMTIKRGSTSIRGVQNCPKVEKRAKSSILTKFIFSIWWETMGSTEILNPFLESSLIALSHHVYKRWFASTEGVQNWPKSKKGEKSPILKNTVCSFFDLTGKLWAVQNFYIQFWKALW